MEHKDLNAPKLGEMPCVAFPLQLGKLTDNGATPWYTTVGLGTPAQELKFMVDSGTDNTWITSVQCTTNACKAHDRFDFSTSSTYRCIDPRPTIKNFGPWGTMTVNIGEDIFTIEHCTPQYRLQKSTNERMNFEVSIYYKGCNFQELACDGGIAIPSPYWKGDGRTEALMLQLKKDGKISYAIASFWSNTSQGAGECLFGGIDFSKFDPESLQLLSLQDHSSSDYNFLWCIDLKAFLVNGTPVEAGITTFVLDTGSSFFKGPETLINTLVNSVTDNGRLPTYVSSEKELYNYPVIALVIGSAIYKLTPQQYFLKLNDEYWELGIQVLNGMPEGMLLVGSLFLDTVYTIFDYELGAIGLAIPR
jgi:Eukaryotic aspartyl protease